MRMAKAATDDSGSAKVAKTGKPGKGAVAEKPGFFARTGQYFRDVRAEMTRVVWPTRTEVLNSSVVVVTTLIFFTLFIMIVDLMVQPTILFIAKLKIGG